MSFQILHTTYLYDLSDEVAVCDTMESGGGADGREIYTSISIEMENLSEMPSECCIYRVPPIDMVLKAEVYAPRAVSIGPFHYKKEELQVMEKHKLRYMKVFLTRTNTNLDDFISEVKRLENEARKFYSEKIALSVEDFVKKLIIDSFFILETMIGEQKNHHRNQNFYFPNHSTDFKTDLFLLENQIPFFVLDKLFELASLGDSSMTFLKVCVDYIALNIIPRTDSSKMLTKVQGYLGSSNHKIKHFVDLLRIFHLPSNLETTQENVDETAQENVDETQENVDYVDEAQENVDETAQENVDKLITIPNAVQLQEAGVQLLKVSSSDSLLDIKFTNGMLEIPVLIVHKYFKLIMSNIFVLEKYHYPYESYIGHYASFMQMLVDTDKDADLLIQNGIIEDWVGGSSTVADLFSKVGDEVWNHIPSYYLYDISERLNEYCNVARHKWMASFKRDYCSSPWIIASTIAAVMVLILTFLSTIAAFRWH
ncbi:hypothetical protein LguiA_033030 [Lonicera macranthoides]